MIAFDYTNDDHVALLEADGREVKIDGIVHILKASTHQAVYPYREMKLSVVAEPKNKGAKWYQSVREELGDEFVTEVADSPEMMTQVLNQV